MNQIGEVEVRFSQKMLFEDLFDGFEFVLQS